MTPELLNIVFTGLVALVGAFATFQARRSQRNGEELRALRDEVRALRRQRRLADQYLGRVLRIVDFRGIAIPSPPEGLFDDVVTDAGGPPAGDPDDGGAHRAVEP